MKKIILSICLLFAAVFVFGQKTITGVVSDVNGEPLIGANVLAQGTTTGTITDLDGNFVLEMPESINILIVSYTGFESKTIDITGLSSITVTLAEGRVLDEVVVTALGVSREEKALGYAVQQVDSRTIQDANVVSAIDALAGAAAGVQITSSSGAAGASSRIVLRGQTSFNGNNEALLVIDGVRMNNDENTTERSLGGVAYSNRAMDLNPNDIESVSILKGAAATALYGLEGARGVVLITTKSGQKGGLKVDVNANLTFSQINNVTGLQDEYVQGSGGTWQGPETGQSGSWGPHKDDVSYDGSEYAYDNNGRLVTDGSGSAFTPYDNIDNFFRTGVTRNLNIAFSGGNDQSNYRFSFGNSSEQGVIPKNTFNRYNVGLKVGSAMYDNKLNVSFSANYANSGGRRIQQGSNTSGVMLGLLRTPISFDNANGFDRAENEVSSYQFADFSQRNYRGGGGYDNPFWIVNNAPFNDEVNRFLGSTNLSYSFHDWFSLNATLGLDAYSDNRIQRFEVGSRNVPGGQVIEDNYNYRHTDFYFTAKGQGEIAPKITLSYTAGINLYNEELKQNYIQGDGLNFPGFMQLGNTANISSQIVNTDQRTAGIFGTVDFGYDNWVYLTLSGRNDYSSTLINPFGEFSAGDISFFYPAVSLGIVFSEKVDIPGLSFGKIRASYAEVGGGAPSPYLTSTPFILPIQNAGTINDVNDGWTNGLGFPFMGTSGFVLNGVAGNPTLTPSRTKDIELGLDLSFLNDRIGIDITGYTRESVDQIIPINIANSTGFQRAVVNSGELATVGGEVVLNLNPIRKDNMSLDLGFNFSSWRTTVEALPEGVPNQYLDGFSSTGAYNIAPETDENGNIITTYQYGQLLGGAFQRVNTDNGTFDGNMPYNPDGALVINNDPTSSGYGYPLVDPTQRVIGNPNPDWLLGINATFRYENLSISALFDIREGGDIWNGTKGALTFFGRSELTENRGTVTVFDGVLPDGTANNIAVPLDQGWYQGNGGGFGAVAEHFIEDGSFRRLRFVTIAYDLGNELNIAGFDKFSVSVTGRNLFLSTPYTGFDPELSLVGSSSNGQGLDYFQMPNTRSIAIGLNATF
jgi:TonB-linked SusC/RagA family outer membrane protein